MINADDAVKIILDSVHTLGTMNVSLERSLGSVLAEDIVAEEDIPSFDNAGMDGYAVRSEDVQRCPVILKITGEVQAGAVSPKPVGKGESLRIMTGAKIPLGADTVVQVEWTEQVNDNEIKILRKVVAGHNIRPEGLDIQRGTTEFQKGKHLRPQEIGVLASIGKRFVEVYRIPRVSIVTTGNEIVEIDKPLREGTIRNSNAYSLQALVRETGCEAATLGIAKDEAEDTRTKIAEGLTADMLITSGGISVGKYDVVAEALKKIGAEIKFRKVNIKPGMPMMFAQYQGKPIFGLPGNPVSTVVTFLKFVKPAILAMMGHRGIEQGIKYRAILEEEIKKTDGKRHFIRGILGNANGRLVVRTTGSQVSNVLTSVTNANCLVIVPEEKEIVRAGEEVEVELI